MTAARSGPAKLRRDLGTMESYAALLGILIGAGIFRVTSEAWGLTGPSVILAYLLLAPAVLAMSVSCAVFLATPLGQLPGGEYTHISQTFGGFRIAFMGVWLKIISYLGALAYLANACADYIIEFSSGILSPQAHRLPLAQAAGEVKESTRRLPRIFFRGLVATTVIFFLMSAVAFGVLPGTRLHESHAPMTDVASVYLPFSAAWFVTLGAIMALTTSLNSTMLVPSKLGIILAGDHLAPRWIGAIVGRTGTPVWGLTVTLMVAALLLVTGQVALALNIAVFALVILYFIHSLALLLLPWRNRPLFASVTAGIPLRVQRWAVSSSFNAGRTSTRSAGSPCASGSSGSRSPASSW
jgi:amino acid transporter